MMMLKQAKKIAELETYGWSLHNESSDTRKLLCGLPVKMCNLRKDMALVYPDGTVRAVEYHPTLARTEDYKFNGTLKPKAEYEALEHLKNILSKTLSVISK